MKSNQKSLLIILSLLLMFGASHLFADDTTSTNGADQNVPSAVTTAPAETKPVETKVEKRHRKRAEQKEKRKAEAKKKAEKRAARKTAKKTERKAKPAARKAKRQARKASKQTTEATQAADPTPSEVVEATVPSGN